MLQNIHVAHLSIGKSELWQNGWLDPDAVLGGEWGRAWYGCIKFFLDSMKSQSKFQWNLPRNFHASKISWNFTTPGVQGSARVHPSFTWSNNLPLMSAVLKARSALLHILRWNWAKILPGRTICALLCARLDPHADDGLESTLADNKSSVQLAHRWDCDVQLCTNVRFWYQLSVCFA